MIQLQTFTIFDVHSLIDLIELKSLHTDVYIVYDMLRESGTCKFSKKKTNVICLFVGCWDSTGGLRLFVFLSIYRSYRCNPFYFTSISRTVQTEQFSWLKGECTYDRTQSERQVFKTKVSEVVQTRLVLTWLTDWLTEGWTEPLRTTVRSDSSIATACWKNENI